MILMRYAVNLNFGSRAALLCLTLPLTLGCGAASDRPATTPVRGTVTLGGEPLGGAQVVFLTDGAPRMAEAVTDAQGTYELTTFTPGDGAVPGEHQITVRAVPQAQVAVQLDDPHFAEKMQATHDEPQPNAPAAATIPPRYADFATSGLVREVEATGPNVINLELTE